MDDQPITPCHGPRVVMADDEVVQRRLGGLHLTHFCSNYFVIYHQNECSIFGTVEKNGLNIPGGPRSRLEQRPGCGYKQKQMAHSCCPVSCQGPEDLSAK